MDMTKCIAHYISDTKYFTEVTFVHWDFNDYFYKH